MDLYFYKLQNYNRMELLLTIFFIIILIGFLLRLLSPYLLKWFVNRMTKRFDQQYQNYNRNSGRSQRPEGEVTIEQNEKPQDKVIDKNIGDYVDFEEE